MHVTWFIVALIVMTVLDRLRTNGAGNTATDRIAGAKRAEGYDPSRHVGAALAANG